MQSIQDKIIQKLQFLPEASLNQVLDFVESLAQGTLTPPLTPPRKQGGEGVPGKQLLRFAGTIPCEHLQVMTQAIEVDWGKVEINEGKTNS